MDSEHGRLSVESDFAPGLSPLTGEHGWSLFGEATCDEQRAGATTVLDDTQTDRRTAAVHGQQLEPLSMRAGVLSPLIRAGRWTASLLVARAAPRAWQEREVALVRSVAERAWFWVEHMRLRLELAARERLELTRRADLRFELLVNGVTDYAIFMLDLQGHVTSWNRGAQRITGYTESEAIGAHFRIFYTEEDRARDLAAVELARAATNGRCEEESWRVRKDGTQFWANVLLTALHDEGDKLEGFAMITRDHSERRRNEEALQRRQLQLAASVREREVLLQEVHHRVKNNLQVISSLLNMQKRRLSEPSSRAAFDESRQRIHAIALIHEKLYQSFDYSNVQFSDYVSTLADSVFKAAGTSADMVKLDLQVEQVSLAVDKAIPCGLVLNELITNTLKHGFPGQRHGTVKVELRNVDHGTVLMSVTDDGVGMPADLDLDRSPSLGMQLVTTLVRQLRGQLEVIRAPGTTFRIRVPMEAELSA